MLGTALRLGTVLGFVASVTVGLALAQEVRKDVKSGPQSALRAKSIIGAQVQLKGNASAGTIEDIVFDDEGVIDYFIVSANGKMVTVPWEAAKINFEKRTAVINITPEQYQKIPTYSSSGYPDFYAPAYQKEIYGYYDIRAGQARRLERRMNRR